MACQSIPRRRRHTSIRRCLAYDYSRSSRSRSPLFPRRHLLARTPQATYLRPTTDANPSGVEGDLYWAGQALNLDDASIDRDIIAAGDTLSIRDCTVGGAVRSGGTHYRYRQDHG